MSGFLSRMKAKKKGKPELRTASDEHSGRTLDEAVSQRPQQQSPPASPSNESYAVPVQASSIFSGLHLSSSVAVSEAPDSPYMKRSSGISINQETE